VQQGPGWGIFVPVEHRAKRSFGSESVRSHRDVEKQRKLISALSHLQQAPAQTGPLFANARNKALISSEVPRACDQRMAAIRLD
jgi:hypothetical protein